MGCWDCKIQMTNKLEKFVSDNQEFFKNKLIQSFLENDEHVNLLEKVLNNPSRENQENLDKAFKTFYFTARFSKFVGTLIYFNAINYDKKRRRHFDRYILTVDQPISNGEDATFKDSIATDLKEITDLIGGKRIEDSIENPIIYQAISRLTENQKIILSLAYVEGFNDSEIANIMNKSQQAVSKAHKKALKSIKDFIGNRVQLR